MNNKEVYEELHYEYSHLVNSLDNAVKLGGIDLEQYLKEVVIKHKYILEAKKAELISNRNLTT